MEAFSLLKYWRGGGGGGGGLSAAAAASASGGDAGTNLRSAATTATTTTIVTAVSHHDAETDDDDDDGPFFDLEFAVQDEAEEEEDDGGEKNDRMNNGEENQNKNDDVESEHDGTALMEEEDDGEEREFNFTISSNSSGNEDRTDPNLTLSPSDDLFFKGRLVPIEPSSLVFNTAEPNSKPQFPVSLLKSATKFRVFMLGFKKSKQTASEKPEPNNGSSASATTAAADADAFSSKQQHLKPEAEKEKQNKFFTVKFKVEEVPIVSLFTRDNGARKSQSQKHHSNNVVEESVSVSDEKRFSKDVMQKYLKKVKPLYVRVSKRYSEKLKFSGQLSLGSAAKSVQSPPPSYTEGQKLKPTAEKSQPEVAAEPSDTQLKSQKQANIPERLRVVCKQLGKSRSASSAVAAAPAGPVVQRRDDSLLQQQDNIQSAILHCKRSFNASRDSDSSLLPRSISDPSKHKSTMELSRKSSDVVKD